MMNLAPPITVLLADDHRIVREGLRRLLEIERDIEVVGEAATGRQAVEMTAKLRPDVVVMDIAMPRLNGLEATRRILETAPEVRVLILSAYSDDAYVEKVMELGAAGYLIKQTSARCLSEAVREIRRGKTYFSPAVARRRGRLRQESLDRRDGSPAGRIRLTPRETEVLQLVAEGAANKQVADELGISIKTVEKHRNNLMRKLDIHDTASLTRYAIAEGVIESSVQLTII